MSNTHPTLSGTVSHGTSLFGDLCNAFTDELARVLETLIAEEGYVPPHASLADVVRAGKLLDECRAICQGYIDPDDPENEVVVTLIDTLNDLAPDGTYFGAHEGDGSDFGWWRTRMTDEEYVEQGGLNCPVCGHPSSFVPHKTDAGLDEFKFLVLQWANMLGEDDRPIEAFTEAHGPCKCDTCKSTWTDVFRLVGYDNLDRN